MANDDINRDLTQELFDLANYTVEAKNGEEVVKEVKETLSNYFYQKQMSAYVNQVFILFLIYFIYNCKKKIKIFSKQIANKAQELYDAHLAWKEKTWNNTEQLHYLNEHYYRDSDVPSLLPDNMLFSP